MQFYLLLFVIGGLVLAFVFNFKDIYNTQWYILATATLLAIGLYSSTYGISIKAARRDIRLLLSAVTIGVVVKAFIIGTIISLFLKSPYGYILGIIVAQIDPLSTAALQANERLSRRAKTIVAVWSSFDDPITVILAIYLPIVLGPFLQIPPTQIGNMAIQGGVYGYFQGLFINILFAGGIFLLWSSLKKFTKTNRYVILLALIFFAYFVMLLSFSIAIYFFWMLGIALIGLFMRPHITKIISHTVRWALYMAALLLGILLLNGINIVGGLVLGIAAFGAQVITGSILCRKLPTKDRIHIAIAQQNGITAIILALLFEPYFPGTIALVAPAIVVINTLHAGTNKALDLRNNKTLSFSYFLPSHRKLKNHI